MERNHLYIDGKWVSPFDGGVVDVIEASTEKVMGRVAIGSIADIDAAVEAARRAADGPWRTMTSEERIEKLGAFARALKTRAAETAELVSRQNGMPISLSLGANGYFPAIVMRYYIDLIRGIEAEMRTGHGGSRAMVLNEPIGVVAAITPWNYPQALAAMKLAPALAAGCTVVLKAPPETALDAFVFADAAIEAGLPDGVLNIVPGGRDEGAHLVGHPGVDKVAFTGSTQAGRQIGSVCGQLLRPVTLELGGKSAAILTEDVDLDTYLVELERVSLPNSGQTCHASTRILAPKSRYSEIVDAVTDTVKALRIGDPLDVATQIGPVVSANQRTRVLDYIRLGQSEGARLTTGGSVPSEQPIGWYVEPTVFADVDNTYRVAREEIFGPVLCVIPYTDIDDAVAIANDSEYGLAGTIWTADEERGIEIANRIQTGTIGVNTYGLDPIAPFGGVKASGLGRELGPEGLRPYLNAKSVYLPRH